MEREGGSVSSAYSSTEKESMSSSKQLVVLMKDLRFPEEQGSVEKALCDAADVYLKQSYGKELDRLGFLV